MGIKKGSIRKRKCVICYKDIPDDRWGKSVTCCHNCSRIYDRVCNYIKSNWVMIRK